MLTIYLKCAMMLTVLRLQLAEVGNVKKPTVLKISLKNRNVDVKVQLKFKNDTESYTVPDVILLKRKCF